ncbi:hypothetical protein ACHAWF_017260 [Thalassiosira exigua]
MAPPPKIYTLPEIEAAASAPGFATRLIDAIEDGYRSYSRGEFNAPPIQTMGAPPMAPFAAEGGEGDGEYSAQTCVKSGYVTGASHYVIKVASGGWPFPNSGSMQLYSQRTGRLEAILLDEGLLTELRTAAAGAVAARLLAPHLMAGDEGRCIGVLGNGVQAKYQLRYLGHVTDCRNVKVWGRNKERVQSFIADMASEGWNVRSVATPQSLLDCSLIVTATSSREPLLSCSSAAQIVRPLHITCMGSDSVGKAELDPKLIAVGDLLVTDSRLQTKERGEFQGALGQGLVMLDDIVELGELVQRKQMKGKSEPKNGKDDTRFTIFDSSGVAVQDCVIAMMVNEALQDHVK